MTNEEKAREIMRKYADYGKLLRNSGVAYNVAMEVAAWKEEQLIAWLDENLNGYVDYDHLNGIDINYTGLFEAIGGGHK